MPREQERGHNSAHCHGSILLSQRVRKFSFSKHLHIHRKTTQSLKIVFYKENFKGGIITRHRETKN